MLSSEERLELLQEHHRSLPLSPIEECSLEEESRDGMSPGHHPPDSFCNAVAFEKKRRGRRKRQKQSQLLFKSCAANGHSTTTPDSKGEYLQKGYHKLTLLYAMGQEVSKQEASLLQGKTMLKLVFGGFVVAAEPHQLNNVTHDMSFSLVASGAQQGDPNEFSMSQNGDEFKLFQTETNEKERRNTEEEAEEAKQVSAAINPLDIFDDSFNFCQHTVNWALSKDIDGETPIPDRQVDGRTLLWMVNKKLLVPDLEIIERAFGTDALVKSRIRAAESTTKQEASTPVADSSATEQEASSSVTDSLATEEVVRPRIDDSLESENDYSSKTRKTRTRKCSKWIKQLFG